MTPERIEPGPGQESAVDYPRPPRVELTDRRIRVVLGGVTIADTTRARRVLETGHPPVYYIPPDDIQMQYLSPTEHTTFCEFKGHARYYTVAVEDNVAVNAAWYYPDPTPGYESIAGHVAFYAGPMDACFVDDERARAQGGSFYGGWITADVVGPFKGGG